MKILAKRILGRVRRIFSKDPDAFLQDSRGVIHIGANEGQEREHYARLGLPVIWIEPIPAVFATLLSNLEPYPRQRAVQHLVTDLDGKTYEFHLANNGGASSSILDLARHKELWPEVAYTHTVKLESISLPTLVAKEGLDLDLYNALVLDTQGSELLILRGAGAMLSKFRYVKLEVPDFEAYKDCCTLEQMGRFMATQGFGEERRHRFIARSSVGAYYDVVYRRQATSA